MTNFCTLFDHNYLSRGMALYQSLQEQCSDSFTLHILATDDVAVDWLNKQGYKNVVVQSLNDIKEMYPVLNRLQEERTRAEFSWTLSSFSIQFFLKKFNLESVTYLDADMYFYADPQILFDELDGESVIITPHNYTPRYDQSETSGRYCVQFMYFKNDDGGNKVLEWWRNACEECCCGTPTDGKFGDQKYLDDWLSRFPGIVHEEKHMGCGIAPWNVQQFDVLEEEGKLFVLNKITKLKDRIVFYHFHSLRKYIFNKEVLWSTSNYLTSDSVKEVFYKGYIRKLEFLYKTDDIVISEYKLDNSVICDDIRFEIIKKIPLINGINNIEEKSFVLYGYGKIGKSIYTMLKNEINLCAICDRNLKNMMVDSYQIKDINICVEKFKDSIYLITPQKGYIDIAIELIKFNIKKENIYFFNQFAEKFIGVI